MVESVTCAICSEVYEVPVQVPLCGHAFCRACLQDCCAVGDAEQAKCPLCRKELVAAPWPAALREPWTSRQATAIAAWPEAVAVRGMADLARSMLPPPSSPAAASAALRYVRGAAEAASAARLKELLPLITDVTDASTADTFGRSVSWWLLYYPTDYDHARYRCVRDYIDGKFIDGPGQPYLFTADKARVMPFT